MSDIWDKAQKFEREWWGDCLNTYGEEEKQIAYAKRMGLQLLHNGKSPYNIDLAGKSIVDIGGGVSSLLLKCLNRGQCWVIDPILAVAPKWVRLRYEMAGIVPHSDKGELFEFNGIEKNPFDEVWIYNVLQHTEDPSVIITQAKKCSKIVRIFEWIGIKDDHGHPHELTEKKLNEWLGGQGKTEVLNQNTLKGTAYYGVFKGDHYEV